MSSFYDKKRMIPYISSMFLPSFKVYTVLFILMKTVKLLLFLTIWLARYVDFGRVTSKDFLFTWRSAGCSRYKYEWDFAKQLKPVGYTTVS